MRKTISTLLLAACLPAVALAAPATETASDTAAKCAGDACHGHKFGPKGHRGPGPMAELNLTPEQNKKMRDIMGEQFKAHRDITKKYLDKLPEADKKAMKAELDASKDNSDKAIRAVLNADQQKKFDEMKAKHEERRKAMQEKKASEAAK